MRKQSNEKSRGFFRYEHVMFMCFAHVKLWPCTSTSHLEKASLKKTNKQTNKQLNWRMILTVVIAIYVIAWEAWKKYSGL